MKIAYLLGSLNRGGTETLLLDVFRNAASNNLDAIGIYRKTGVCEQEFQSSGVDMFKLAPTKNIFGYLLKLRTLILKNGVQLVHAQQPIDALFAYFAILGTGVKILLTLHGFDYNEGRIGKLILQFILKRTQLNIYVSTYQKEYYTKKYKLNTKNQKVVYNGISFDKLGIEYNATWSATSSRTPYSNNLRSELQLPSETLLLGTVGNFNLVRDQLTICKFLKLLADGGVDFHFVFVGKRIEALAERYDKCVEFCSVSGISEKVSFLGVRHDVPHILNALDAFIYSTDYDTFGIAVVEAMSCRLPIFVNDWDVMNEITENGKLATLYKSKDEQDLFHQFSLFLQHKQAYYQKANKAANKVHQKFSIENHIAKLQSVYVSLTTNN
ncbi:MAG: hypothetical protein AUK44_09610 [Porphyromonadaceae bacterium CG2_30_38_12]|nr:MAG: hypothetical protein AUK44_09610 [Porphyromonadaceae bacterium CG2_30_38_12]